MKVRMKATVLGTYCSIENGAKRGDIIDLAPELVARELQQGRVELQLDGPIGTAYQAPSGAQMLEAETQVAAAQRTLDKAAR